jgi:enoyl-[acyl-carrier protein] reductase III
VENKDTQFSHCWAIILGGSSGFGLAAVTKLAAHGMNLAILYRELSVAEKQLKTDLAVIAAQNNVTILAYNINALNKEGRESFIAEFTAVVKQKRCVKLLLHSIARGNLKHLVANSPDESALSTEDIQVTIYAMATSLLDWARLLLENELFMPDARVLGLTSEGAHKYWDGYAAVSIAKSSLESLTQYMAVELGPHGLKTNLIQAGVTNTPSLKRIPESEKLLAAAQSRNPLGRITTPHDVANVIYLLCTNEAYWINGAVIHADGGEHCR